MSGSNTSVPSPSFGPQGFVAPTESAILSGVQADVNVAFGGGVNPGLSTPQGQLATSMAAAIGDQNAVFLYLASQVDPAYATGRMQDAIGRIYFITRIPATSTVASCTVSGLSGTVIPAGALAQDTLGNTYAAQSSATIPATGFVTMNFANTVAGATPCSANTLTTIYQSIPGWQSITNPADGIIGNAVESRAAFEERRALSVAQNSVGPVAAVRAAILAASGVLDAFVVDNPTNAAQTIGGVSVAANSLYCVVAGGASADIAAAIYSRKAPGVPTQGATSVTTQDTQSGLEAPYPSYTINFDFATATPVYFAVTIANSSAVPSDAATQISNAIINAFAGLSTAPRARIASTIYASSYYGPVAALGAWAQIVSIYVGTAANPTGTSVTMNTNQQPVIAASQIAVTV